MKRKAERGRRKAGGLFRLLPPAAYRLSALCLLFASAAYAQTTGARLTKEQKPIYPEGALKGQRQGNALLIGKIDTRGKVQDIRYVSATIDAFVEAAIEAVRTWEFKPATRNGKAIEIAANIGLRFRVSNEKKGEIPAPILGDLAVFPADASGKKTAPEGFPIHRGADPRLRVESVLDVPPQEKARNLAVMVQALSPSSKRLVLFEETVAAPAKAKEVAIAFTATVGSDWEDGVWLLRFLVDKAEAGGGQFWLAGDPEHYRFAMPGRAQALAGAAAATPAPPHATPKKK